MGKGKLAKFADMEALPNVFQFPMAHAMGDCPMRGRWHEAFGNDNPIVLELGCGRGEYTVGLARRTPEKNFIGVDIKGSRMGTGATEAHREGIANAAFLRTHIEFIDRFFAPDEVAEIWLTFSDPQMKKATKRLTSTHFLERYRRFVTDGGLIHVKTDSQFLYTYTRLLIEKNALPTEVMTDNLYATPSDGVESAIQTYYESMWRARGIDIKYIRFRLPHAPTPLQEPEEEIPLDEYRSYSREKRSGCETHK